MKSCTKNIIFIFGFLLVFVLLFIPYRSTHIKFKLDPHSLTTYKMTTHKSGYLLVFKYFKLKSNKKSVPGTDLDSYAFNKTLFLVEIIILIVLASFDYFLFCIVFRKRKSGQK